MAEKSNIETSRQNAMDAMALLFEAQANLDQIYQDFCEARTRLQHAKEGKYIETSKLSSVGTPVLIPIKQFIEDVAQEELSAMLQEAVRAGKKAPGSADERKDSATKLAMQRADVQKAYAQLKRAEFAEMQEEYSVELAEKSYKKTVAKIDAMKIVIAYFTEDLRLLTQQLASQKQTF